MGILQRFTDIMSANINALLDKAEDPEKMIDQYLRNLESDLGKVKAETAAVMAEEKRAKRELDGCMEEISKMQNYAQKALVSGNEADAVSYTHLDVYKRQLKSWKRIEEREEAQGTKWYAYLEHGIADPWFNDAPYVDTLSDAAMHSFIEITHEAYKRAVGEEFGKTIPAIFTDEPQFNNKNTLNFSGEEKDVFLPWTSDIDVYKRQGLI